MYHGDVPLGLVLSFPVGSKLRSVLECRFVERFACLTLYGIPMNFL